MLTADPRLAAALDGDLIGFLTAVNADGQPQTSPVWFLRRGEELIVYNRPNTPRLASVAANPKVAFNLRADRHGTAAVLLEGMARIDPQLPPVHRIPEYLDKYREEIAGLGWTPESFAEDYSVGVVIEVTRVRAWGLGRLGV